MMIRISNNIFVVVVFCSIFVLILILLNSRSLYLYMLKKLEYRNEPTAQVDVVLTLAFEPERLDESLIWIESEKAKNWIVSVGRSDDQLVQQNKYKDLTLFSQKTELYKYDPFIDSSCCNTYDEACFLKEYMKKNNLNSALIVSAPYHMKRVKMIFERNRDKNDLYYYTHPFWEKYNEGIGDYIYNRYHRKIALYLPSMKPKVYCVRFVLKEWLKNVYYFIKYPGRC